MLNPTERASVGASIHRILCLQPPRVMLTPYYAGALGEVMSR